MEIHKKHQAAEVDKKFGWGYALITKGIRIVSNQSIKCLDEINSLMWELLQATPKVFHAIARVYTCMYLHHN